MWFKRKTNKPFVPKTVGQYVLKAVALDEWQDFRAFYLRMLKEQPTCSTESYEEMKALPPENWKQMIERSLTDPGSVMLIVTHKPTGSIVGVVHLLGRTESKLSHETEVRISVMAQEHMNVLLMETCWQELFAYLKSNSQVSKIKTAVHTNDRLTLTAYNDLGFNRFGYDHDYYRVGKKYFDAFLMVKKL